jgi:3-oxoacyl-[acyl-carrier-protein] synthase II
MGAVTPLGLDLKSTWENLLAGRSVTGPITRFDTSGFLTRIACEVKDFDIGAYEQYVSRKQARRLDRFMQFAIAVAAQALEHAGLTIDDSLADEVGVFFGCGIGGLETIDRGYESLNKKGPMRVSPFVATYMLPNMGAGQISMTFGIRGPSLCIISACATGTHVIGEAAEVIRRGDARVMLAGGGEAPITPFALAAFHRTQALSTRNDDPEHASRPFDAQRDGFVFGEGAALLVLEDLDFALSRGATPLAEVVGFGSTSDAFHLSAPHPEGLGAFKAIARALEKAGIRPDEVDYINAHGTSTPLNDKMETMAIKKAFGESAYTIPISSSKSMSGHLLGAAGVFEAAVCVQTIQSGTIHPTINYEYPDPDCDLDYVPNEPRKAKVDVALSNSFGFGGHNATIVLRRYVDGQSG